MSGNQPQQPWGSASNQPTPPGPEGAPPGNFYQPPPGAYVPPNPGYGYAQYPPRLAPHHADTLKLMAWLGFLMWIVALIALIMANQDLAAIQSGRMDPSGYEETQNAKGIAKIALIVHACLIVFGMVAWIAMMVSFGFMSHRHP